MTSSTLSTGHWADATAERLIRQNPEKKKFVLASGITPSGVVHFGNFRETMTVDLVARALRDRDVQVRFIFSWDDYDTFRKVPVNMPNQELLGQYLYRPIVDTPDPFGRDESYAAHHERNYMESLKKMGIEVEALFQAKKYRSSEYGKQMTLALKKKDAIVEILNRHRSSPLEASWLPISVYCQECGRDKTEVYEFDGTAVVSYRCTLCGHQGKENVETSSRCKLPWRIDWPMRWVYEGVDFEPGGKDHSSQGGSFTTAQEIVKEVFGGQAPLYLQYDFVSIKGRGGKMSSSKGDLVTVEDVLKVYEPEMVRWIFASYKTNVDFAVSFDLDVLKVYEDYDRTERLAYGKESGNDKKVLMAKRVYELAQIGKMPEEMPMQPGFRHLCNVLQINDGNIEQTKKSYALDIKNTRDERRFYERAQRAKFWIQHFAPDEFKFSVNKEKAKLELNETEKRFLLEFKSFLQENWENLRADKELHEKMYEIIHRIDGLEPTAAFTLLYRLLISQDKGPKLAGFILTIGRERVLSLL